MKQRLVSRVRNFDAFCARLNDGLTAVAILLGFAVMTMSVVRAQEMMPDLFYPMPPGYQLAMGQ